MHYTTILANDHISAQINQTIIPLQQEDDAINKFPYNKLSKYRNGSYTERGKQMHRNNSKNQLKYDGPINFLQCYKCYKVKKQQVILQGNNNKNHSSMVQLQNKLKKLLQKVCQIQQSIELVQQNMNKISIKQHQTSEKYKQLYFKSNITNQSLKDLNKIINQCKLNINNNCQQLSNKSISQFKSLSQKSLNCCLENIGQKKHKKVHKNEINEIKMYKAQIQTKLTQFVKKVETKLNKFNANINPKIIRSDKFANIAVSFAYQEILKFKDQLSCEQLFAENQENIISETIYYIDEEGYLLDRDKCYLVNQSNQKIQLTLQQIKTLKSLNILQKQ